MIPEVLCLRMNLGDHEAETKYQALFLSCLKRYSLKKVVRKLKSQGSAIMRGKEITQSSSRPL